MRGAKCDICGGLFPRRETAQWILPSSDMGFPRRRRVCRTDWKPIEAAWRQMETDRLGPRPDPPMPLNIAPNAPRQWRPEEIS